MSKIFEETYSDPRESYDKLLGIANDKIKDKIEDTWKEHGGTEPNADYETLKSAYNKAERVWKEWKKLKAEEEAGDDMTDAFLKSENKIPTFENFTNEDAEVRTDIAGSDERFPNRQVTMEAITKLSKGLGYLRSLTTAENLDRLSDKSLKELYQLIKNARAVKEAEIALNEDSLVIKGDDGKHVEIKLAPDSIKHLTDNIKEDEEESYEMGAGPSEDSEEQEDEDEKIEQQEEVTDTYEIDQKIITKLIGYVQKNDMVTIYAPNRTDQPIIVDDISDVIPSEGSILGMTENGEEIQIYPQDIEHITLPGNKKVTFGELSESLDKIRNFSFYFG